MAVITTDILLEGFRREPVFDWLGDPANHSRLLSGAFDKVIDKGDGSFELHFKAAPKSRVMGYRFHSKDSSHSGRRILVETTGKRTTGKLHYSLRTMKPSTNTLVTLHMDYSPGPLLGQLLDSAGLRGALEERLKAILDNLAREISEIGD
jgi:carbon monoxide dehydrogenase subunit G